MHAHVYGHVYGHVYRRVYRRAYRRAYRRVYKRVYRRVCTHVYTRLRRHGQVHLARLSVEADWPTHIERLTIDAAVRERRRSTSDQDRRDKDKQGGMTGLVQLVAVAVLLMCAHAYTCMCTRVCRFPDGFYTDR